jgi:hypothetical protein
MQLNVKFKSKMFLSTPRYAAQRWVYSMLCRIAGSHDSALCGIAQSCDSTLCGIARSRFSFLTKKCYLRLRAMQLNVKFKSKFFLSTPRYAAFVVEFNRISPQIRIYSICKTVLAHESGDPGVQLNKKTEGRKSRYCPFNKFIKLTIW